MHKILAVECECIHVQLYHTSLLNRLLLMIWFGGYDLRHCVAKAEALFPNILSTLCLPPVTVLKLQGFTGNGAMVCTLLEFRPHIYSQ